MTQQQSKIISFLQYLEKQDVPSHKAWVYCLSQIKNKPRVEISIFEIQGRTGKPTHIIRHIIVNGSRILQNLEFGFKFSIEGSTVVIEKVTDPQPKEVKKPRKTKEEKALARISKHQKLIIEVIDYLNQCIGDEENEIPYNIGPYNEAIADRAAEGYTIDQFKHVIEVKCHQWLLSNIMRQHLKPSTLFGPKMEAYILERIIVKQTKAERNANAAEEAKSNLFSSTGNK